MILEQAIKEVQQIIGWRQDKVAEITAALQYVQNEREKPGITFPWWLRTTSSLVLTPTQQVYSFPANYIQDSEEHDGNLFIYTIPGQTNSRTVFLKKKTFEEAQVRYFGEWPYIYSTPAGSLQDQSSTIGPGVPIDYVLGDSGVTLYPVPDAAYTLNWSYWGKDVTQSIGQENGWLKNAPWVLIGDAAAKLAMDLGNSQALSTAQNVLQRAEANMFRSVIARAESGRRRSMGSKL